MCLVVKNVTKNVMECFDKAEELLDFPTIGYTVLSYMELAGISDVDETPHNFPSLKKNKETFRDEKSSKIVDGIFCTPNTKELLNVSIDETVESSHYCICKLDVDGTMVYCNNAACEKGSWFHLECLGLEEDEVVHKEWFCSEECHHMRKKGRTKISSVTKTSVQWIEIKT